MFRVELLSRQLSCSKRQAVFNYLATFLPCTKHTLLKRAKNLVLEGVESKLKAAIKKYLPSMTIVNTKKNVDTLVSLTGCNWLSRRSCRNISNITATNASAWQKPSKLHPSAPLYYVYTFPLVINSICGEKKTSILKCLKKITIEVVNCWWNDKRNVIDWNCASVGGHICFFKTMNFLPSPERYNEYYRYVW